MWFSITWLGGRIFDIIYWYGVYPRRNGHRAPSLLITISHMVVFFIAFLIIFALVLQKEMTHAVISSSVVVGVLGLAGKDLLSGVFSGISLNMTRPYAIGDWIKTDNGDVGQVQEISWGMARMLTADNNTVLTPNNEITGNPIINYSRPSKQIGNKLSITLKPDAPMDRVSSILKNISP